MYRIITIFLFLVISTQGLASKDKPEAFEIEELTFTGTVKGKDGKWIAFIKVPDGRVLKAHEGIWVYRDKSQIIKINERELHIRVKITSANSGVNYKTVVLKPGKDNDPHE